MPSCIPTSDEASCSRSPSPEVDPDEVAEQSGFFKRLRARGTHKGPRIKDIVKAARRDDPPVEPPVWQCCNSSCGIDCVVTMWWEEEKTWRDCHEDWKEIKERIKAEEEDRLREEEEERELNGGEVAVAEAKKVKVKDGGPKISIGIEEVADKLS